MSSRNSVFVSMSNSSAVAVAFEVSAKPSSHWIVEPAKSGRATCKGCKVGPVREKGSCVREKVECAKGCKGS